jgi:hypothetical protein
MQVQLVDKKIEKTLAPRFTIPFKEPLSQTDLPSCSLAHCGRRRREGAIKLFPKSPLFA